MRVQNTSRYPVETVRQLVEFGMHGVNTARLEVHVRNSKRGYRGMAYSAVPVLSSAHGLATVDRLVTIGIGPPASFPVNNMRTTLRWHGMEPGREYPAEWAREARREPRAGLITLVRDHQGFYYYVGEPIRHPYGGQRSPYIEVRDWQEAIVVVAAHEARHVYQFQYGKRRSEVDAERWAAKRLEGYRGPVARPSAPFAAY